MSNLKSIITMAVALAFAGSALAANPQPADGEGPYEGANATVVHSETTRAAVEAEAANDKPASGMDSAADEVTTEGKALTREEVVNAEKAAEKAAGQFPDKSGEN